MFWRMVIIAGVWAAVVLAREAHYRWQNTFIVRDEFGLVDFRATVAGVNIRPERSCFIEEVFSNFETEDLIFRATNRKPTLRDFCLPLADHERRVYQTQLEELRAHLFAEKAKHNLIAIAAWQVGVPIRAIVLRDDFMLNVRVVAQKDMSTCEIDDTKKIVYAKNLTIAYEIPTGAVVEKTFRNNRACELTYML